MMCIPKCFVALLPYLRVRCGEHEQHAKQHDMSCDAAGLHVMDLYRGFSTHKRAFHVEEVDIMRSYVHYGPEEHSVGDLAMEPLALVQR